MSGKEMIASAFRVCALERRAALIPFLALGDPDFATTRVLARAAAAAGANIIELGFPFTDPLADGPVIQAAYARALKGDATVDGCFDCIQEITSGLHVPIMLMVAWNLVLARGVERFCEEAAAVGASALLVPDLLIEDATALNLAAHVHDLATVFLVGPDSDEKRVRRIAQLSTGFVYLVRRRGVTGVGVGADDLEARVAKVRSFSSIPVAVGFGIASAEDVREVARVADGVIVGSAFVQIAPDIAAVRGLARAMAWAT